ncbi:MAG: type II toxin-antitoxin system RelE/ParE family toxin [Clostridia bacterium]|nr:type II toxin-antitoxin system RelE/ParE family toxin [Clostridia bacterium]
MSEDQKIYAIDMQDKAAQMLYAHVRFVANVSVSAARKLRVTLYEAIDTLKKMPLRCPVFRTRNTSDDYRQLIVGRYQIIFVVDERDSIVHIRYILDSRQRNDL